MTDIAVIRDFYRPVENTGFIDSIYSAIPTDQGIFLEDKMPEALGLRHLGFHPNPQGIDQMMVVQSEAELNKLLTLDMPDRNQRISTALFDISLKEKPADSGRHFVARLLTKKSPVVTKERRRLLNVEGVDDLITWNHSIYIGTLALSTGSRIDDVRSEFKQLLPKTISLGKVMADITISSMLEE